MASMHNGRSSGASTGPSGRHSTGPELTVSQLADDIEQPALASARASVSRSPSPAPRPPPLPTLVQRDGLDEVWVLHNASSLQSEMRIMVSSRSQGTLCLLRQPQDSAQHTLFRLATKLKLPPGTRIALLSPERQPLAQMLIPEPQVRAGKGSRPAAAAAAASGAPDPDTADQSPPLSNMAAFVTGCFLQLGDSKPLKIFRNVPYIVDFHIQGFPLVGSTLRPVVELERCEFSALQWRWYRTTGRNVNEAESKEDGFGPVEYIARKPTDVLLSISRSYTPTDDDIGSQLLCVCTPVSPQGVRGLTVVALVGATRRSRRRQLLDRQTLTIVRPLPVHSRIEERYEEVLARPTRPGAFRVMSYNVLFDNFVDSSWALENIYPYLAPEYASHEYRSQLVLNEILSMHPDVVCLQEMGHGEFHDYYQMHLARSGLDGVYANKISNQAWGMAIFYRRNRFTLLETRRLDLTRLWEEYDDMRALITSDPAMEEQMRRTSTVAQIMLLQPFDRHGLAAQRLVVANVHLFSHPKGANIRVLQTAIMVRRIQELHPGLPVVYCGDFNADASGGAYHFLAEGHISERHFDWVEGYAGLAVVKSSTKAEREEFWHSVLKLEDMYSLRAMFVRLCAEAPEQMDVARSKLFRLWQEIRPQVKDMAGPALALLDTELASDTASWMADTALSNPVDLQSGSSTHVTYAELFQLMARLKAAALRDEEASSRQLFRKFMRLWCHGSAEADVHLLREPPTELPANATMPLRPQRQGEDGASLSGTTHAGGPARADAASQAQVKGVGLALTHDMGFLDAQPHLRVSYGGGNPPEPGVVDYIFYQKQLLRPLDGYPAFTAEDVAGGIPSAMLPSDHVSILVDFEWIEGMSLEEAEQLEGGSGGGDDMETAGQTAAKKR